ncbi:uncharacterized protein ARMOST_20856 [Armillaria ostoyae]|uniref:Uncharacterized protein n=1 Tax=Armillaria ostoyae TaxID=47428 RepID=A0A284S8G6_ARMOS|nr:uncharacterized protein ARMOST_20856 [Armillaria ostoyae]
MSPTLLKPPSLLSFWATPPQNSTRALPHSINPPTPIVAVIVVLSVGILIIGSALRRPSHAEMAANIESPDVWHTLVACGNEPRLLWQQQHQLRNEIGKLM